MSCTEPHHSHVIGPAAAPIRRQLSPDLQTLEKPRPACGPPWMPRTRGGRVASCNDGSLSSVSIEFCMGVRREGLRSEEAPLFGEIGADGCSIADTIDGGIE